MTCPEMSMSINLRRMVRYMAKPSKNEMQDYEESIKNYGNKIEHIETFVEAVRRFPGKLCTARHIRNGMK